MKPLPSFFAEMPASPTATRSRRSQLGFFYPTKNSAEAPRVFNKFQPTQRKQCVGLSLDHPSGWFEIY